MKPMLKVSLWLAGALLVACSSRTDRSADLAKVRSITIMPVISSALTSTTINLEQTVQESIQRSLTSRGYTVTKDAAADATVRAAWLVGNETQANGKSERIYTLSVSIYNSAGDRIFSARSIQGWSELMWTESRVNSEISALFRALPEATPAMAPVKLK